MLGCAYLGYIVHAVLCYSFSAKAFAGISPFTFFEKASPAMIFAFTSTSSAATIPLSKECADELGAESDVSSFVIPLGATINMDGTAIYQCVATIFLATCCGMTLTLGQMVTIVRSVTSPPSALSTAVSGWTFSPTCRSSPASRLGPRCCCATSASSARRHRLSAHRLPHGIHLRDRGFVRLPHQPVLATLLAVVCFRETISVNRMIGLVFFLAASLCVSVPVLREMRRDAVTAQPPR